MYACTPNTAPARRSKLAAFAAVALASVWAAVGPAHAGTFELETATIADINAAFDAGALTSEKLVELYLARIDAYDDRGPSLNALILVNPQAREIARALDAERKATGPRSALHGIPVILKDNFDTADLPTTAGSVFLAGSLPPKDAFMVAQLRAAGAIILAKANLSEFASSGRSNGFSSFGGQTRNPHDPARGPAGSSGGSGAAMAAWYATVALGTDTGGSIRGPSAANGIAGLKPTHGLVSRAGIVPLALSFDTGGPMARSVYDVAAALGPMTGIDPNDPATQKSLGVAHRDYTVFLEEDALDGARLGLLTDYAGSDEETRAIFAAAVARMKSLGATVIEIELPDHVKERASISAIIRNAEFKAQIGDYLGTLRPGYPRTLDDLIAAAKAFPASGSVGQPNPARWEIFDREATGFALDDPVYLSARDEGTAMIRSYLRAVMLQQNLDAFVYPTAGQPAQPIVRDYDAPAPPGGGATNLANITGFPDAIVPAGITKERLPVTVSFLGSAFSEPKILAYAYAFEQAVHARVAPSTTPALPGEKFDY